ncbi:MAG: Sec-independent protein translocase protein TatB [Roseovarius sp.]|nr:Sec-independent protein translocase protein TatB [Roseovarius sp.]MCY4314578.1 Sec-independent protein translocase protein TatB [Roseovarius sp.]
MLDLGWAELMVIAIVALIVVGPKDLPGMFRTVGNFVGKAKRMAREFSRAMNDAADGSGVNDVAKTLKKATDPVGSAMSEVRKSAESFTAKTMAGPASTHLELDPERQEKYKKIREETEQLIKNREKKSDEAAELEQASKANANENKREIAETDDDSTIRDKT